MKDLKLTEFVEKTASSEPVPGGGSIAAVSGTLGASLAEMVANLTIGKKKYENVENEMIEIAEKAKNIRNTLLDYIEKDSQAFNKVIAAFKLPKETDEEKSARREAIQSRLKKAAEVPFEIAEKSFKIMDLAETVVENGNTNAVTDGLVAAMMSRTAVLAAILNVKINLESIKDEEYVKNMAEKVKQLEEKVVEYEKRILNKSPF